MKKKELATAAITCTLLGTNVFHSRYSPFEILSSWYQAFPAGGRLPLLWHEVLAGGGGALPGLSGHQGADNWCKHLWCRMLNFCSSGLWYLKALWKSSFQKFYIDKQVQVVHANEYRVSLAEKASKQLNIWKCTKYKQQLYERQYCKLSHQQFVKISKLAMELIASRYDHFHIVVWYLLHVHIHCCRANFMMRNVEEFLTIRSTARSEVLPAPNLSDKHIPQLFLSAGNMIILVLVPNSQWSYHFLDKCNFFFNSFCHYKN